MIIKTCKICHKEFKVIPAREKTAKFCSCHCKYEFQKTLIGEKNPIWQGGIREKQCEICGKSFKQKRTEAFSSFRERRFCSLKCGWIGQKYNTGKEHPNWNGGKRNRDNTHSLWARKVISRDNATCKSCGATNIELHAHHIESWIDHEESRFDVNNGITLCCHCHWKLHSAPSENGVNSVELLRDNTEPSRDGNISEGVTTNGRAYRRWEGKCHWCGTFLSKRLSDVTGKQHIFCGKYCMGKHRAATRIWRPVQMLIPPTAVIPTRAPCPKGMI